MICNKITNSKNKLRSKFMRLREKGERRGEEVERSFIFLRKKTRKNPDE